MRLRGGLLMTERVSRMLTSIGGRKMDANGLEVGDERNTRFELPESRRDVTPGFDPDEEPSAVSEGHSRFPRRRREEDIPQESLAERIRSDSQGG
jgi:hypothetical protein